MKHTENGILHHRRTTGCEGTFIQGVSEKGSLGAFEIYRCDGVHTKGRLAGMPCNYAGRGAQLREGPPDEPTIDTEIEGIVFEEADDLPEEE